MKKIFLTLFVIALLALPVAVSGQVVIEPSTSNAALEAISVLQLESGGTKALRLPQLTSTQRNALTTKIRALATSNPQDKSATGLMIINISNSPATIEFYNGSMWLELDLDLPEGA